MEENAELTAPSLAVGHSTFIPNEEVGPRRGFGLGFVLGLVVGIVATLFLVPKTGGETREQVRETITVFKERLTGMMTGERAYEPDATDHAI